MSLKSLILADIHANKAALQAVFDKEGSWDEILFLGDAVGWGPNPKEVLSLLSEQNGVFVMGNHDLNVLRAEEAEGNGTPDAFWIKWSRDQISSGNLEFLAFFSPPCTIERGAGNHGRRGFFPDGGEGGPPFGARDHAGGKGSCFSPEDCGTPRRKCENRPIKQAFVSPSYHYHPFLRTDLF
jgi:hypothetical protein